MQRRTRTAWIAALAALFTAAIGCAPKKSTDVYQLRQIQSQYFLLPPNTSASQEKYQTLSIPVTEAGNGRETGDAKDCSVKGDWFSFYRVPGNKFWTVQIPTAAAWEQSGGTVDMKDEWQGFEAALYGLQQRHCFASLDEYFQVKQRIAASLPAPADETLFYRYGYGPGGYVDLAPDMQVRIERDFYRSNHGEQTRPEDYRGTTITTYAVTASGEEEVKLALLGVEKKSPGGNALDATSLDTKLASQFSASSRLRLFLQGLVVSGNAKTPAILIGALRQNDLSAVTTAIETNPQIACADLIRWRVTCVLFRGPVTVSPMLHVTVNGASSYIPVGSKLWIVLPYATGDKEAKLLRTVRLQRLFRGKVTQVLFARNQEEVSQLLLIGGDRISWSRSVAAKR